MKKLLGIVVLSLLWSNVGYSYQYCYKAFDTIEPIKNASFMNIGFLKLELECLNKTKEAKIFEKKSSELFEYTVQKQFRLLIYIFFDRAGPDFCMFSCHIPCPTTFIHSRDSIKASLMILHHPCNDQ